MTLEEMRATNKPFLTPMDVCEVLQCSPYSINVQMKNEGAESLPFPAFKLGSRVKIPREAFVRWAEQAGL